MVKSIGSSANEVEKLVVKGVQWIQGKQGNLKIDFLNEESSTANFLSPIKQITIMGIVLLLGKIFDEIGFNAIEYGSNSTRKCSKQNIQLA